MIFTITPSADSIPFNNQSNGYSADNLQQAIEEAGSKGSYSYKFIPPAKIVAIPQYTQMIVKQRIRIYGQLQIKGQLVIL